MLHSHPFSCLFSRPSCISLSVFRSDSRASFVLTRVKLSLFTAVHRLPDTYHCPAQHARTPPFSPKARGEGGGGERVGGRKGGRDRGAIDFEWLCQTAASVFQLCDFVLRCFLFAGVVPLPTNDFLPAFCPFLSPGSPSVPLPLSIHRLPSGMATRLVTKYLEEQPTRFL